MTEREKMVEEMAKKVCIACGKCKELKGDCYLARNIASVMIDDGYRKVPAGSVVLTKEEYERLASYISEERARENFHEETEKLKEKIRRETAMEILLEIINKKEMFVDSWEMVTEIVTVKEIKMVAEEYGVEVEE